MKRNYKTPAIEVIDITTITLCTSNLDVDIDPDKQEHGVADGNSRRGSWGSLWNED